MELQSFLEQLTGAGLTVPSVEELGDEAKQLLVGLSAKDNDLAEAIKAKEVAEEHSKGITQDNSRKDLKIKELQDKLDVPAPPDASGDVAASYQKMMSDMEARMDSAFGKKIDQTLSLLEEQSKKNEQLEAKVARQNALNVLIQEYPVLKDPEYHSLMPEIGDEAVLRERAETLTKLRDATALDALEQIRAGHIPATAPPRVMPGSEKSLEREIENIARRRDTGQITVAEAGAQLDDAMTFFNKE